MADIAVADAARRGASPTDPGKDFVSWAVQDEWWRRTAILPTALRRPMPGRQPRSTVEWLAIDHQIAALPAGEIGCRDDFEGAAVDRWPGLEGRTSPACAACWNTAVLGDGAPPGRPDHRLRARIGDELRPSCARRRRTAGSAGSFASGTLKERSYDGHADRHTPKCATARRQPCR